MSGTATVVLVAVRRRLLKSPILRHVADAACILIAGFAVGLALSWGIR